MKGGTNVYNEGAACADGERKCDVLIMVAKDKEFKVLKSKIFGVARPHHLVPEDAKWASVEIAKNNKSAEVFTFNVGAASCVCCCVTEKGAQGMDCYEGGLLNTYKPHYLTTFGFAAGKNADLTKVMIITEFFNKATNRAGVCTNDTQFSFTDFWREHPGVVLQPELNRCALVVAEVIEGEANVARELGARYSCLEMEIATIYGVLDRHNNDHPTMQTLAFPAFKGISDVGDKKQRNDPAIGGKALENAAEVMLEFINKFGAQKKM
eukprot:TRINITY_DN16986_c0_g1_i1.p1 TRINITY_DN16986_c0_g1~~TRINITY_DN16986_c0_g1_i1.p1  ORF type:complete len:307 (+),score=85.00 TRINITY_DN16986_c0_g1_i1:126-923(+)